MIISRRYWTVWLLRPIIMHFGCIKRGILHVWLLHMLPGQMALSKVCPILYIDILLFQSRCGLRTDMAYAGQIFVFYID